MTMLDRGDAVVVHRTHVVTIECSTLQSSALFEVQQTLAFKHLTSYTVVRRERRRFQWLCTRAALLVLELIFEADLLP